MEAVTCEVQDQCECECQDSCIKVKTPCEIINETLPAVLPLSFCPVPEKDPEEEKRKHASHMRKYRLNVEKKLAYLRKGPRCPSSVPKITNAKIPQFMCLSQFLQRETETNFGSRLSSSPCIDDRQNPETRKVSKFQPINFCEGPVESSSSSESIESVYSDFCEPSKMIKTIISLHPTDASVHKMDGSKKGGSVREEASTRTASSQKLTQSKDQIKYYDKPFYNEKDISLTRSRSSVHTIGRPKKDADQNFREEATTKNVGILNKPSIQSFQKVHESKRGQLHFCEPSQAIQTIISLHPEASTLQMEGSQKDIYEQTRDEKTLYDETKHQEQLFQTKEDEQKKEKIHLDEKAITSKDQKSSKESVQDKSKESVQDKSKESVQDKSKESVQDKSKESVQDKSKESVQDKSKKSVQDKSKESAQKKSKESGPKSSKSLKEEAALRGKLSVVKESISSSHVLKPAVPKVIEPQKDKSNLKTKSSIKVPQQQPKKKRKVRIEQMSSKRDIVTSKDRLINELLNEPKEDSFYYIDEPLFVPYISSQETATDEKLNDYLQYTSNKDSIINEIINNPFEFSNRPSQNNNVINSFDAIDSPREGKNLEDEKINLRRESPIKYELTHSRKKSIHEINVIPSDGEQLHGKSKSLRTSVHETRLSNDRPTLIHDDHAMFEDDWTVMHPVVEIPIYESKESKTTFHDVPLHEEKLNIPNKISDDELQGPKKVTFIEKPKIESYPPPHEESYELKEEVKKSSMEPSSNDLINLCSSGIYDPKQIQINICDGPSYNEKLIISSHPKSTFEFDETSCKTFKNEKLLCSHEIFCPDDEYRQKPFFLCQEPISCTDLVISCPSSDVYQDSCALKDMKIEFFDNPRTAKGICCTDVDYNNEIQNTKCLDIKGSADKIKKEEILIKETPQKDDPPKMESIENNEIMDSSSDKIIKPEKKVSSIKAKSSRSKTPKVKPSRSKSPKSKHKKQRPLKPQKLTTKPSKVRPSRSKSPKPKPPQKRKPSKIRSSKSKSPKPKSPKKIKPSKDSQSRSKSPKPKPLTKSNLSEVKPSRSKSPKPKPPQKRKPSKATPSRSKSIKHKPIKPKKEKSPKPGKVKRMEKKQPKKSKPSKMKKSKSKSPKRTKVKLQKEITKMEYSEETISEDEEEEDKEVEKEEEKVKVKKEEEKVKVKKDEEKVKVKKVKDEVKEKKPEKKLEISEPAPHYLKELFKRIISCGSTSEEEEEEEEEEKEEEEKPPPFDEEVEKYKADKRKHYLELFNIKIPSDMEANLDEEARAYKQYKGGFGLKKLKST